MPPLKNIVVNTDGIKRILGELDPRAAIVIANAARAIEGNAVILAPVDTGALKASIYTDIKDSGLTAEIGATVEYAIYQELGFHARDGRPISPHPFLVPALERVRSSFLAAWKELTK